MRSVAVWMLAAMAGFSGVWTGATAAQDTTAVTPPSPVEGVWMTQSGTELTIAPCPGGFCGFISKIVVPEEILEANREAIEQMSPEQFFDANNKDPALRSRPILGLQILALRPGNSPAIFDGDIYNPQDGNTYSGYIEVQSYEMLRLNGCVLYNIICKGEDWIRAPEPVPVEADIIAD